MIKVIGFTLSLLIVFPHSVFAADKGALIIDGLIQGYFESQNGDFKIKFKNDTFLYRKGELKGRGISEPSSCAVADRKTGEALSQGNFLLIFDGLQCCYNIV